MFPGDTTIYSFDEWVRLVKTRFSNIEEAKREYPSYAQYAPEVFQLMEEHWEGLKPVTWDEGFAQPTDLRRRQYFFFIGPVKLFHGIEKKQKIDEFFFEDGFKNNPTRSKKGHQYELWKVDATSMKIEGANEVYLIRCWCPSTENEYIIFVDQREDFCIRKPNVKEAVAWTCRSPYQPDDVETIHRQGEVYTFVLKEGKTHAISQLKVPIHLKASQYWSKLGQQT